MIHSQSGTSFEPRPMDAAGVVSWIHLGDLHMTSAGEPNHLDLGKIVDEVNAVYASSVSFVFLPGDVADDGSRAAYQLVRSELDRLQLPWCAILGDHDVHEKSYANFLQAMSPRAHYAFTAGRVRFVAMNAFDVPDPASFTVSADQLSWVERELHTASVLGQTKVILLHCYPSDLKGGAAELMKLMRQFSVSLIDMGHTHYNEIANDGRMLFSATRSTGQVEEGPVGYSVTNMDADVVSWRFVELGKLPVVVITAPGDERLLTETNQAPPGARRIRAKFWGESEPVRATAHLDGRTIPMERVESSQVWQAHLPTLSGGVHPLRVAVEDAQGNMAFDEIRVVSGQLAPQERAARDQDNALPSWPEHGLLGTQLGPNKNGKKW